MLMNMTANLIGLTNAATPLGLRAMKDLESLNPRPGTATNAMCMFLAINTSSIQLIPMTAIGILAVGGSANPTAIVGTSLLATLCSTFVGIGAARLLQRFRFGPAWPEPSPPRRNPAAPSSAAPANPDPPASAGRERADQAPRPDESPATPEPRPLAWWGWLVLLIAGVAALWAVAAAARVGAGPAGARWINAVSVVAVPLFLGMIPLYAALRGVRVFDEFVEGAREGFPLWVRIIPYLVAMLVAIGMFRAAGGMDVLARGLGPLLGAVGFPPELLPMSVMRPLSGSGTIALFRELVATAGADSLVARIGGTILGSTETTFYVIAVYFGSVGIARTRHAVPAGLLADVAGILASIWICRLVFTS
jgi:spore maturation protein SpmB